ARRGRQLQAGPRLRRLPDTQCALPGRPAARARRRALPRARAHRDARGHRLAARPLGVEAVRARVVTAPDPARHPILLFDGVCNLCHGGVRFVLDRDRTARFRFAPLQSDVGRDLVAKSGRDPDALGTMMLIDADGAHEKSTAILRTARALGLPWSWSWPLIA